ncbi:MAG TPA: hypothetical protein VFW50_08965 [Streptosporangiaceae bacterium]|nr:hypothetical protein [Streptosporangiaceae bacterium]
MEGWRPVENVIQWGFGQRPVVMANEAHDGLARSVRIRVIGARMIRAAHQAGVRRLAMEALHWPAKDVPGPITTLPDHQHGYLAQPEMRAMIGTALDLGWTLRAYEAEIRVTAETDRDWLRSMEFTNWREREQAANLCRLLETAPGEPVLVWCGNSHASKHTGSEWVPMSWHFREVSSIDPFVIDQTVTVAWDGEPWPWARDLLGSLADVLAAHGGTAAILREQAPPPLDQRDNVDALVVSTDNALTEDGA